MLFALFHPRRVGSQSAFPRAARRQRARVGTLGAATITGMSVRYQSTRGGVKGLRFEQVLLSAYAPDGGLYVPELDTLPTLQSLGPLDASMTVAQVTARIIAPFTGLPAPECERICATAYRSFSEGREPSLPLVRVGGRIFLETGNGPTLAFKDVGQQVVAQLLNAVLGRRRERATILVETSGDTGPAAIEAVRRCEHVTIHCLYPEGRVSAVQELQMVTVDSPNVHVYRTEGDTDEQVATRCRDTPVRTLPVLVPSPRARAVLAGRGAQGNLRRRRLHAAAQGERQRSEAAAARHAPRRPSDRRCERLRSLRRHLL